MSATSTGRRRPPVEALPPTALRPVAATLAVAVVGDDPRLHLRIRAALRREGLVASVEDGGRTRLHLDHLRNRPDVVVLAGRDPNGFAAETHGIRRRLRDAHVVLVLVGDGLGHARHLLDAGVDGIVLERELETTIALAVRSACVGQLSVPGSMRHSVELPAFSHRERQILRLVAAGHTNEEIARRLYLSKSTVAGHLTSLFRRLGVRTRSEAVAVIFAADEPIRRSVLGVETPGAGGHAEGRAP